MKKNSILKIALLLTSTTITIFISFKGKSAILKNPYEGGLLRFSTGGIDLTCTRGGLGNQCDWTRTEFLNPVTSREDVFDDNGLSATSINTFDTISFVQFGDYDTNDLGAPPAFIKSMSTTIF